MCSKYLFGWLFGLISCFWLALAVHAEPRPTNFDTLPENIWTSQPGELGWEGIGAGGLCLGDANHDGQLDLAVATYPANDIAVTPKSEVIFMFDAVSSMPETFPSWIGQEGFWSTACMFGFMGSNQYPDLIVANGGPGMSPTVMYKNTAQGLETSYYWATDEYYGSSLQVAVGDVNQDGTNDLFISYYCFDPCSVVPSVGHISEGGVIPQVANWISTNEAAFAGLALGDPDRSGVQIKKHVVTADGTSRTFWLPGAPIHSILRILVNGGNPGRTDHDSRSGWVQFTNPPTAGTEVEFLYETSSELDLIASTRPGSVLMYKHIEGGVETTPSWTTDDPGDGYREVEFVDLDLDGYPEIFAAGSGSPCAVYKNNGGVIDKSPSWTWNPPNDDGCYAESLAVFDANGDGYPDVMTVTFTSFTVLHLFLNDGGMLEPEPSFTLPWNGDKGPVSSGSGADLNADGMPDLVVGHADTPIEIYWNLGTPLIHPQISQVAPVDFPNAAQADIFVRDFEEPVRIFVGDTELSVTAKEVQQTGELKITVVVPPGLPADSHLIVVNADLQASVFPSLNPENQPPVVEAGAEQTIIRNDPAILNATVTDETLPAYPGKISMVWSKVSGPGDVVFDKPQSNATKAWFYAKGDYVLRLVATDGELIGSDDVTVHANNEAPVVNAGEDQTVTLPATAQLHGTASDDGIPEDPGTVTTKWSKIKGIGTVTFVDENALDTTASFAYSGQYVLRLTANDGKLEGYDEVNITVNPVPTNVPPVVEAGEDQTVTIPNAVSLSGSVTDDGLPNPPAQVTTSWIKVKGPGTVTFENPSAVATQATFSIAGIYVLRLTADDTEAQTWDNVTITVNASHLAPVVEAGADQVVDFGAQVTLAGSATDDGLPNPPGQLTIHWSKVSGPGSVFFEVATSVDTIASFSEAGLYILRLSAFDGELKSSDELAISVKSTSGNQAPVVDAGQAQTLTFPETASLTGTMTDDGLPNPPGNVVTEWKKIQGPGVVSFENAGSLTTKATFSEAGRYLVALVANDSELETSDELAIDLISSTGNEAPYVDAGEDQTINFNESASLQATVTDDMLPEPPAQVTITWTKAWGPGTVTFGDAHAVSTTASFSEVGEYTLRLTAEDGELKTRDEIIITVIPQNQAPTVEAGPDLNITLPGTANLDATVNDDGYPAPPALVNTTWSKDSGPGTVAFEDVHAVDTIANFTVAGSYVLRITANDGQKETSDTMNIQVNPKPDEPDEDSDGCGCGVSLSGASAGLPKVSWALLFLIGCGLLRGLRRRAG